ncbi:MAG: PD-(D/E)XK nuclease family protein [Exiguobacterium sp.]|nr:PD-(D/E)XK nuclease family protein [Exiguobacterium sp.]
MIVDREWSKNRIGAIDLLIEFPPLDLILFIENKIHPIESAGQLDRYLTSVTEYYRIGTFLRSS